MKQLLKTKHAGKKLAAVLIAFTLFLPSLTAQVTIGSNLEPNEGSLLQLKEKESVDGSNVETGLANSGKGLNLPRVALSHEYKLFPMFENPQSAGNYTAEFIGDSIALKKKHKGLMVYSVSSISSDPSNVGIHTWNGEKWVYSGGTEPWYNAKTQAPAINNTDEVYLDATVTIGKAIDEEERVDAHGALLQLVEERKTVNPSRAAVNHNAYHGFAMPRVELSHKNELYPMFLEWPEQSADGVYNTQKEHGYDDPGVKGKMKASHKGLMVYNVTNNALFQEGIYVWDGSQWLLSQDETTNPVRKVKILIGTEISTETVAYYGELQYSETNPSIDDYALIGIVPIVTGAEDTFVPNNFFFSTSLRREDYNSTIASGKVMWKMKIDNRNTVNRTDSGEHMNKYAKVEAVYVLYTSNGGTFSPISANGVSGVNSTQIVFEGSQP